METNVVKVDGQRIDKIIRDKGLTRAEASREMGAGTSYLSRVILDGKMNPAYLRLFCLEFDVDETDLIATPSRLFSSSRDFVQIDSTKCRKLIYKNGYKLTEVCEKLGYENSWMSNTLSRGTMHINALKRFAELMGVSWQSLEKDEPAIEEDHAATENEQEFFGTEETPVFYDSGCIKCIYNLATSIEAALTNFRQDLLELIGGEKSDG